MTNTPGVLTDATADLTFGLILAVARRIVEGEAMLRAGEWKSLGASSLSGHRSEREDTRDHRSGSDWKSGRTSCVGIQYANSVSRSAQNR